MAWPSLLRASADDTETLSPDADLRTGVSHFVMSLGFKFSTKMPSNTVFGLLPNQHLNFLTV
jgi:hypothetical protein